MSRLDRLWEEQCEEVYCERIQIDERGIEYTSFHASTLGSAIDLETMEKYESYGFGGRW